MKAFLALSLLLIPCPAHSQADLRLTPPPAPMLQEPTPMRHALAPVTVRKSRLLSFRGLMLLFKDQPAPTVILPAEPAPEGLLQRTELPIAGGHAAYLVSGGYFMRERPERQYEAIVLQRTWPIGNEILGIVVKSSYTALRP